ncbi:sensor histidine kinase [Nostocoides sp. F2B08]|uniref:sensor histidine kinase n=1 Tax=Nostocoides sp. F2B08 TaxID=2653936 RepID=UPI00186ADACA|nr:histidine kinase [Tetrasphaera sp. F2B08]
MALVELFAEGRIASGDLMLAVLATAPVAWRTVAPRIAFGVCVLVLLILSAMQTDEFTVAELLALMLVTYTIALLETLRPAVVALAVVIGAALGNSAASGSRDAGDYVFPVILLAVPWTAGRALRRWRERTEELEVVTAALRAEREQHARLAVAAERGRIARDLHDSLAQALNAVVVHTEVAEASLGRDDELVAGSLERIGTVARAALGETRRLLNALRDLTDDDDSPRLDQLAALAAEHTADGLAVDFAMEGRAGGLPASVEAAVFRIVQEGLTNVAAHSRAGHARVRVCLADVVSVRVEDDGPSIVRDRGSRPGLGLVGMRERATLLGGDFRAGPAGDGFVLEATIPRVESP